MKNFFVRIKRAIFNVEKYGEFLLEKTKVAIKYFFTIILLISVVLAVISTYNFSKIVKKGFSYIENELPDFTYENGNVDFASYAEGYDKEMDLYDIINSDENITEENIKAYKEKLKDYTFSIILLRNRIIVGQAGNYSESSYEDFVKDYDLSISSKADLVDNLNNIGIGGINVTYFILAILSLYISNIVSYLSDIAIICIFGYLVSRISGVPLNFSKSFVLAVYSITLSMILRTIYSIAYSFTGFVIEYFDIMYLVVSYIYIIAAILIIKSDLIKQQIELQKIYEVEKQVKQELDEKNGEEEDKQKDKEKEDDKKDENKEEDDEPVINREPDGSEI